MSKKPPPAEDEEQSKRFLDTAKELEAAGELDPIEGEATLERILRSPARLRRQTEG